MGGSFVPPGLNLRIACPVDIEIYDEAGTLVGRVVDNVVDTSIESSAWISVVEDVKDVFLPLYGQFTFELTGTDTGTMDLTIITHDRQTFYMRDEDVKEFSNVELQVGKEMTIELGGAMPVEDARLFVIENGIPVAEIHTDGTETPLSVDPGVSGRVSSFNPQLETTVTLTRTDEAG